MYRIWLLPEVELQEIIDGEVQVKRSSKNQVNLTTLIIHEVK